MRDYGQFCPIARSSELLAERWTPIIVRNLLNGCRTFNEIRQGAPGISTALLAQRLEALERHGVLLRTVNPSGRGATYELTEMGLALRPVMDAMGLWGAQWLEIEPRHRDPAYVLWATMKLIDVDKIPAQTTVVRFALRDRPTAGYCLILRRPQPELCTRPGGYTEDIVCRTDSTTLIDLHLKKLGYRTAIREGRIDLIGPPRLTHQFHSWFRTSPFADFIPADPAAHVGDGLLGP
ncbi:MAG TPA: helix-turn-helix domain-containing protein [Streptosporangiaceae bacterium]